ncbi:MAG TPA: PAS domain S-box protein [Candidatus Acidoferrum sp.]|nr:PAS domain S-box protein [Candidatus Acidoferrum sp.]
MTTNLSDTTDPNNSIADLRRAGELNRQILLSAQEGIAVLDRQLKYVLWNPYMEQMTGIKESELLGKHPLELFPTMADDGIFDALQSALAGETGSSDDVYFTVPSTKREGWCSNHFAPLRDAHGEIVGVVATVRDVTQRKRTETRLYKSESLLAQAEQLANMGSWEVDLQTQTLSWSAHYYRIVGWEPEPGPLSYCHGTGVIHPDDLERANRDMNHLISTGQPLENEMRIVRSDGTVRVLHSRAVAIMDDTGRTVRVQGMSQDVTERKNEEERLRKSEALLSQAEEIADFGSWETDLKTGKSTLSKHLLQMFGLASEKEWDRDAYWKRVHPQDRARARGLAKQGTIECKPFEFKLRYQGADGTYRTHFDRAIQIPGPDGKAERSIGVSHDITDQVRAEEELRQLSARLLRLQDEARRQIARDLHDGVSQHLLAISLNLLQLANSAEKLPKRARKILADTRKDVRNLSKGIRSLSYLLHPPLLDELGLVSAIEEYAKGFSKRSGIEVRLELPSYTNRMPIECETALFRIVQEALGNMQRHSRTSTGAIRLRQDSNEVVLEISDSGRGIAGISQTGDGTLGVGILGMRERMRQLGGRLGISSGDRGTTVRGVLPVRAAESEVGEYPTDE